MGSFDQLNEIWNKALALFKEFKVSYVEQLIQYYVLLDDEIEWCTNVDTNEASFYCYERYEDLKHKGKLSELLAQFINIGPGDGLEVEIFFGEGWDLMDEEYYYIAFCLGRTDSIPSIQLMLGYHPDSEMADWIRQAIRTIEMNRYRSFHFRPSEELLCLKKTD